MNHSFHSKSKTACSVIPFPHRTNKSTMKICCNKTVIISQIRRTNINVWVLYCFNRRSMVFWAGCAAPWSFCRWKAVASTRATNIFLHCLFICGRLALNCFDKYLLLFRIEYTEIGKTVFQSRTSEWSPKNGKRERMLHIHNFHEWLSRDIYIYIYMFVCLWCGGTRERVFPLRVFADDYYSHTPVAATIANYLPPNDAYSFVDWWQIYGRLSRGRGPCVGNQRWDGEESKPPLIAEKPEIPKRADCCLQSSILI